MVARMLLARLENPERFVKGSEMLDGKKKPQNIYMRKFRRRSNRNLRLRAKRVGEWHPLTLDLEIQNRTNNHLLAEECPPVTNIRHNLLRNIPQSAATPWANYGRNALTAPPPALPHVTPHSSCLQEAAAGATPHITPVKSHFSYLCFLRSVAVPTATKPRQGNEDDRQKKTEQEQQTAQKQTNKKNTVQD